MKNIYVIKRLLRYVSRYKGRMAIVIFIGLIGVLIEVAKPLPVKIMIDNVLTGLSLPGFLQNFLGTAIAGDKTQLLILCVLAVVFITICSSILSLFTSNLTVRLSQKLVFDLSIDFYSKLQQLSLSFYAKNKTGDLLQRMSGDVFVVYFLVAQIIIPFITSSICLLAMFYVMARIDLTLSFIALSVIPLLGIALGLFMKPMNNTTNNQHKKLGELSALVQQSLSSMKLIQAFARENYMNKKVEKHTEEFGQAFRTATNVSTGYNQAKSLITGLVSAGLIGLGAYRGIKGGVTAGDLYIFIGYITALYAPITSLFTAVGTAVMISSRGKRVFEILDSNEIVKEKKHPTILKNPKGNLTFENVIFGYNNPEDEKQAILKDINFHVNAGQIVALVGPTGAGKTSLISLITRFYDPWKGRILLEGHDIKDLQLHSLRENVSLVLQDTFLFPMSVKENIAFGNPSASFEEIENAAKMAQAHHFINKLPKGYETLISESGASLSGGEKQRIALARAFLKNAAILILDEPTSALDALTEARIFKSLSENVKDRTVFIISHRLSTIKHADQILLLKDGVIVESGTHEYLVEKGEEYADLYKYQHIT